VLVLFAGIDVFGTEDSASGTAVSAGTGGDVSAEASTTSGFEGPGSEETGSATASGVGSTVGVSTGGAALGRRWGKCKARVLLISWIDKCKVSSSAGCQLEFLGMVGQWHTMMEGI
jgi:hypothetical protein